MESDNRRTAVYRHREPVYRYAKAVKRIHEVIAQEHDFGISVAVHFAKSDARVFVLETACTCGTTLVDSVPHRLYIATFDNLEASNRSTATQHNHFVRAIAIQVCTSHAELFIGLGIGDRDNPALSISRC